MLIVRQAWPQSTGSSGPLASIELSGQLPSYSALYVAFSTLASTQSFGLQSAQESSGPWVQELGTSNLMDISTAVSTQLVLRVNTGPIGPWVRPILKATATGAYNFLLIGTD